MKDILLFRSYQKLLQDFLKFYQKTEKEPAHGMGLKGRGKKLFSDFTLMSITHSVCDHGNEERLGETSQTNVA